MVAAYLDAHERNLSSQKVMPSLLQLPFGRSRTRLFVWSQRSFLVGRTSSIQKSRTWDVMMGLGPVRSS